MKGSRALKPEEIAEILATLSSTPNGPRDCALFLLGVRTGFRISELLSLRVSQIFQNGHFVDRVTVERAHMKRKLEGRTVILHPEAKEALEAWVTELTKKHPLPDTFIFKSRNGGNQPIDRQTAWELLSKTFKKCGLTGKLGTHCMRKTFAKRVYDKLGHDLVKTQKALNHKSINSTVSYLSFADEDIDDAILKS